LKPHLVASALLLLAPALAHADDKQQCAAAYTDAQSLRDAHKLIEERAKLRVCAQPTCAAFIQKDCTEWLAQADAAVPSVVVLAHTATGESLVNISVTMDGAPFTQRLDGRAIDVDPGVHTFVLTTPQNEQTTVRTVVPEGVHAQKVEATIGHASSASNTTSTSSSPLRPIGFVVLGVGVASIVTGTILGVVASATKSSSCDAMNVCNPGSLSPLYAEANASTATLIAGGILAAAGITFVIVGRPRSNASTAFRVSPTGLSLSGAF
jgi:hypothetical protein